MKNSVLFYVNDKHRDFPGLSLNSFYLNKIVIIIETEGVNQDISFYRNIKYFHIYIFIGVKLCD